MAEDMKAQSFDMNINLLARAINIVKSIFQRSWADLLKDLKSENGFARCLDTALESNSDQIFRHFSRLKASKSEALP